jgi:hypothetical protein
MPSLEEAVRCPKCDQPGMPGSTQAGPRRSKILTYVCENKLCRWYGTGWVVQVGSDGSIPDRRQGPKQFEIDPWADSIARRQLEEIAMADPTTRAVVEKTLEENG